MLEIVSTVVFGGLVCYSFFKKENGNDADKIQKIAKYSGLTKTDEGKTFTIHLRRKKKLDNGMEYVYRIPLGLSLTDFENKIEKFQDGLNNKQMAFHSFLKKEKPRQKKVSMSYDGMLRIKVTNEEQLPDYIPFEPMQTEGWKVPIGIGENGWVFHDFEKTQHLLEGGATDGGKSSFLNMIICHLMENQTDNVKFYLIDLKGGIEFNVYEKCKQVIGYAEEPEHALDVLTECVNKIEEIQRKFKAKGHRNCQEAGIKERYFVIIDEIAELSSDEEPDKETKKIKKECEYLISQIARKGRSQGFRLITATQHPTQDYVPKSVKRNSEARLCFRVRDAIASNVVLDTPGGEKLPKIKGRAIYQDKGENITVQIPHMKTVNVKHHEVRREKVERRTERRTDFTFIEEA